MRPKDKLEKYIERYIKRSDFETNESDHSRYYHFNGRVVRVSDHIGTSSDGDLQVILDSADRGHYIVYAAVTRQISVLTYKEVKQMMQCMNLVPSLISVAKVWAKPVKAEKTVTVVDKETVLGVPTSYFTSGQLSVIRQTARKQEKLHK